MQKLVLGILLDAFRHDYLRHTNFLRKLAGKSFTGKLREQFGFCPRAAYFGGLEPGQSGFTNMYWLDPARSPFSIARFFDGEAIRFDESLRWKARAQVDAIAATRTTPFAATYARSGTIPFNLLHQFDVAEKVAPWDPGIGYRSIFHALDEKSIPWFECSWPVYNGLKKADDPSILEHTLNHLKPEHSFGYVHFSNLDGVGHTYGPGSKACVEAIQALDKQVGQLITWCAERYEALDVVIFGDHGMVSVARNVDIAAAIQTSGLTVGRDFTCFIDSTMVRFWFHTRAARTQIERLLAGIPDGYMIDERMQKDLEIEGCDPRNAELFFMAHPGIQFFPNFFQESGHPPKGMHGYHPDCPDNQAFFLTHLHGQDFSAPIATVKATQVFHTFCDLLGLNNIDFDRSLSAVDARYRVADAPRFSEAEDAEVKAVVNDHMTLLVSHIRETAPDAQAVVLSGSFGRGEGSVLRGENRPRPLNDYDVLVACDESLRTPLKTMAAAMAPRLGLDCLDIVPLHPNWFDKVNLTMLTYDLRYGSRTIWGNETLLESIPQFAPADIPLWEGYQLLLNRIAGLLIALKPNLLSSDDWNQEDSRFLVNQMTKAGMAMGDFRLLSLGDYCSSYRQRLTRLRSLHRALNIGDDETRLLERAYSFKLSPDYKSFPAGSFLPELLRQLEGFFVSATLQLLGSAAGPTKSVAEAVSRWEQQYAATVGEEMATLRAAMVVLLFSIRKDFGLDATMLQEAASRYPGTFDDSSGLEQYAQLRSFLIQKWEEKCH